MPSTPLAAPLAVGAKDTSTVQVAFGARELPQVDVPCTKPVPVTPTLVIDNVAVPVLVSVTVRAALFAPTVTLPKATGFGAPLTPGAATVAVTPVPLNATCAGEPEAFDAISRLAARLPSAPGVNVSETVQLALICSEVPLWQLPPDPSANSVAFVPLTASPLSMRAAVPELVTVSVFAVLTLLSGWLPKPSVVADRLTAGAAAALPVPLKLMVPGLPVALWAMVIEALRAPAACGVNTAEIEHELPAATELPAPQLPPPLASAKSPGFVPPRVTAEMARAAEPVFDIVAVMAVELLITVRLPKERDVVEGEYAGAAVAPFGLAMYAAMLATSVAE